MPPRTDVTIDWTVSPRIVTVLSPSTEISLQDLYDTLRNQEQRVYNSSYDQIVRAAGKDELGGDVFVGLTITLLDAKLAFQSRKTWTDTGSVTTPDTTGVTLTDSAATFITAGIQIGAIVANLTDGSIATVLRVISQTQLKTDGLGGGADNQFGASDSYRIQNVTQCEVSGGNLVALDSAGDSADPILPTAGTQIVRTSSSSATIAEVDVGGTFTADDRTKLVGIFTERFTTEDHGWLEYIYKLGHNRLRVDPVAQKLLLYDYNGTTVIRSWSLIAKGGGALVIADGVQVDRTPD